MKAAEVTTGSASSKVISFTWHPGRDKIESLLLERTGGCTKHGVYLLYHSCFYYTLVFWGVLCVIW